MCITVVTCASRSQCTILIQCVVKYTMSRAIPPLSWSQGAQVASHSDKRLEAPTVTSCCAHSDSQLTSVQPMITKNHFTQFPCIMCSLLSTFGPPVSVSLPLVFPCTFSPLHHDFLWSIKPRRTNSSYLADVFPVTAAGLAPDTSEPLFSAKLLAWNSKKELHCITGAGSPLASMATFWAMVSEALPDTSAATLRSALRAI